MHASLTKIVASGAVLLLVPLASAQVLDGATEKVVLLELVIDATATELHQQVQCSPDQVTKGVWNLINFAGGDNSLRRLVPNYHPLKNEAAWYINNKDCPSLAPYVNGIGFDSFDVTSGDAVLYLAAFNQKSTDQSGLDDGSRVRLFFQPEFDVINVVKFPAQCERVHTGFWSALGRGPVELVCHLSGGDGTVRFSVRRAG